MSSLAFSTPLSFFICFLLTLKRMIYSCCITEKAKVTIYTNGLIQRAYIIAYDQT
jgi:hypothetical protein